MAGVKGKSGPRRKPTKLRILEGNRSRTPIPKEVLPTADAKKPSRFKTPLEKKAWEKLTPPLFACGLATNADQEMLERMCYWWAVHIEHAYMNPPDLINSERAFKQFDRIAGRFGMTPSDRAGLDVTREQPKDDTERFLA